MINPKIYSGGCLDLQTVLRYLEEKNDLQAYEYEVEQGRVDNHLQTCKDCYSRIKVFIDRYGPGDDPGNMEF